ncbi:IS66 family transposase [Pelagibaculum spongiae]|uniref:Transposase IS66 central domain-containing protein n=1 Tax=Pelagibaculum spongiae TaxID=2080658 RepID=A0A2V1GVY1_9GAMM|nr:hypothetical protein DC094_19395 [Pelagibaculum spongiae]
MILFHYDPSRSSKVVRELLAGYHGWLQSDYYMRPTINLITVVIYLANNLTFLAKVLHCLLHVQHIPVRFFLGLFDKDSKFYLRPSQL